MPVLDKKGVQEKTKVGKLKIKEGYANKAKGVAQVLWESGLWDKKMKLKLNIDDSNYPDVSASTVLANCEDFREEVGAMEKLVCSHDHICLFSSKGHPEIAGAGIEYDWGVSKKMFRKHNDHKPKNCVRDIKLSLDKITLPIAYNTSRRARSYMSAYVSKAGMSHLLIEKFVKIHKCHRNVLDQETKYLETLKEKIEGYVKEMAVEKISIESEVKDEKTKREKPKENSDKVSIDLLFVILL